MGTVLCVWREGLDVTRMSFRAHRFVVGRRVVFHRDDTMCWVTTGMFPQEIIISFARPVQLFRIKTLTKHGTKIC
jgi:hypothetical protein